MVCDQQRYPGRRLGQFLLLRDLTHHLKFVVERAGNRLTPEAVQYAEEGERLWNLFAEQPDVFSNEALEFVSLCRRVLGRGFEVTLQIGAKKPELAGDETLGISLAGRVASWDELVRIVKARGAEVIGRWEGSFVT
jgi:hypothetical protein